MYFCLSGFWQSLGHVLSLRAMTTLETSFTGTQCVLYISKMSNRFTDWFCWSIIFSDWKVAQWKGKNRISSFMEKILRLTFLICLLTDFPYESLLYSNSTIFWGEKILKTVKEVIDYICYTWRHILTNTIVICQIVYIIHKKCCFT